MASGPGAWPWPVEYKQAFVVLWMALCGTLATWRAFKWMAGLSYELQSAKLLQLLREVCGIVTPGMVTVGPDIGSIYFVQSLPPVASTASWLSPPPI